MTRVSVRDEVWGAFVDPDAITGGMPYLHENFVSTGAYLALYHAGLIATGAQVVTHLVTGLPVAHYRDDAAVAALRTRLTGSHQVAPGRVVEVRRVSVIPQAIGAYIGASDTLPVDALPYETVLVIDVGHFSVDWVYLVNQSVRRDLSGSTFQAGATVLEEAARVISETYAIRISMDRVFRMVRDGASTPTIAGKVIDLRAALDTAGTRVSEKVANHIKSSLRADAGAVTMVVMTGGGASFFQRAVTDMFAPAKIVQLRNSVMANANGFRLYAKRQRFAHPTPSTVHMDASIAAHRRQACARASA
ncbi:hypothetical protein B1A_09851 [mine drainage metagenome]|uniref:Uncharacterized protein n=1 Tax=mine drainage metagenome TaxID=410659 RepID=T1AUC0_9ZZZZ